MFQCLKVAPQLAFLMVIGTHAATADEIPFPKKSPECAPNAKFTVADFSVPVSDLLTDNKVPVLNELKSFNVNTIFRYYDHENETLPGKTLHGSESDAILASGLKIGVVFQHHNDDPAKFLVPDVGRKDADRALILADENRQPYGTAIYFGVDGPERHLHPLIKEYKNSGGQPMSDARKAQLREQNRSYFIESYGNFLTYGRRAFGLERLDQVRAEMMNPVIVRYFEAIRMTFRANAQKHEGQGYRIGMYCTGAMCLLGDDKKLADYLWISPEGRNDPEYRAFLGREGHWHLVQQLPTICPGWGPTPDHKPLEFDFSFVSQRHVDFGQWAAKQSDR